MHKMHSLQELAALSTELATLTHDPLAIQEAKLAVLAFEACVAAEQAAQALKARVTSVATKYSIKTRG